MLISLMIASDKRYYITFSYRGPEHHSAVVGPSLLSRPHLPALPSRTIQTWLSLLKTLKTPSSTFGSVMHLTHLETNQTLQGNGLTSVRMRTSTAKLSAPNMPICRLDSFRKTCLSRCSCCQCPSKGISRLFDNVHKQLSAGCVVYVSRRHPHCT